MPKKAPTHRQTQRTEKPDDRPSAFRRGYDTNWRKLRLVVLRRQPVCAHCKVAPSKHVDHVVSLEKGGTHHESNLEALCHRCHSIKTARFDGSFGRARRTPPRGTQGGQNR